MEHEGPLKTILNKYFEADFDNDEYMKEAVTELAAYVKKHTAAAPAPSGTKTKATGTRPYAQFVKLCSAYSKGELTIDTEVVPGDHYRKKDTKSYNFFSENLQDIVGQQMTFDDLFQQVHAQSGNVMKTAGICWGLLTAETQGIVLSHI